MRPITTGLRRFGVLLALLLVAAVAVSLLGLGGTKPAGAAFTGTNGLIVFASDRTTGEGVNNPEGDTEIFTMNEGGTGLTQLTFNDVSDDEPAWSPNGQEIAFQTRRDGNREIYKMSADGSSPVRLTNDSGLDSYPAWSPDGTQIAFESARDGNSEIYTMSATDGNGDGNGDNAKRLTKNASFDSNPAWSPDGTQIAFESDRDGNFEIYTMKPRLESKANRPVNLSKNSGDDKAPNWHPDGTRIAFHSSRGVGIDSEIYSMAPDGTDQIPLTENQDSDETPIWSPDGSKIVFAKQIDRQTNDWDVYVMDRFGLNPTNITQNPAFDFGVDWQPT